MRTSTIQSVLLGVVFSSCWAISVAQPAPPADSTANPTPADNEPAANPPPPMDSMQPATQPSPTNDPSPAAPTVAPDPTTQTPPPFNENTPPEPASPPMVTDHGGDDTHSVRRNGFPWGLLGLLGLLGLIPRKPRSGTYTVRDTDASSTGYDSNRTP